MLRRYWSLPRAERRALWSATWRLAVIRLSLLGGIQKTRLRFSGQADCTIRRLNKHEQPLWAMRAAALRRAGSRLSGVHCLARSLALRWWMRSEGIDADCLIGVKQRAGKIESHAWVEVAQEPVGECAEDLQDYTVIARGLVQTHCVGANASHIQQNDNS